MGKSNLPRVPDLECVVLAGSDHPLALAMERYCGDIAGMSLERKNGIRMSTVDVVETDMLVAGSC